MLSLEYRHATKEKAKSFIDNLKNKLDLNNSLSLQGKKSTKN